MLVLFIPILLEIKYLITVCNIVFLHTLLYRLFWVMVWSLSCLCDDQGDGRVSLSPPGGLFWHDPTSRNVHEAFHAPTIPN